MRIFFVCLDEFYKFPSAQGSRGKYFIPCRWYELIKSASRYSESTNRTAPSILSSVMTRSVVTT